MAEYIEFWGVRNLIGGSVRFYESECAANEVVEKDPTAAVCLEACYEKTPYYVLSGSVDELVQLVNIFTKHGYVPVGGIAIDGGSSNRDRFFQTLFNYDIKKSNDPTNV